MTPPPPPARALALASLTLAALAALTGCGDDPPPRPSTPPASSPSPTPTPTPSPTGPVRATDDPTWTPDQLAAVQAVDGFHAVRLKLLMDPVHANASEFLAFITEPLYGLEVQNILTFAASNSYVKDTGMGAMVIPVTRSAGPEAVVDGHREIHVVECEQDPPGAVYVDDGIEKPYPGNPRVVYDYAVQWVDQAQGWRVASSAKVRDLC